MTPSASAVAQDSKVKPTLMAKLPLDRIKFSPKQQPVATSGTASASVNNFDQASGSVSNRSGLKKIKLSRH